MVLPSTENQELSAGFIQSTYGSVRSLFLLCYCVAMLCPLETMLLLFVISYTFVWGASVLSMNKSCTIWISRNNYCLTIVKLVLNFRVIVCEERKGYGKCLQITEKVEKGGRWSVTGLFQNQSSTEFTHVGKVETEIEGIPLWPMMSF